jgi:hypothetical protein
MALHIGHASMEIPADLTPTSAAPTILEQAFRLTHLERRHPDTEGPRQQLIDTVGSVGLTLEQVRPLEIDLPDSDPVFAAFGRSIGALTGGVHSELAGWITAGVATTIIAAAHEATTETTVSAEDRLRLQHALATFAGLPLSIRESTGSGNTQAFTRVSTTWTTQA